jgi:hypothetical protein
VLWGSSRRWPRLVDLAELPSSGEVQVTQVDGARGGVGADSGDMLAYSAEVADVDGDGADDLVANEMGGNGLEAGSLDVGNLLVLSGTLLARGRPDCAGRLEGTAYVDACGACVPPGEAQSCVRFSLDVLPLFLEACSGCHGASAGLSLFSYEQLMSGASDNGPVVIPGDPEGSLLWQKIESDPPFGERMPPSPEPALALDAIDAVFSWIAGGARDN